MNCITLIGMPGAGKSTVGKVLADELRMVFVDTDDVLRERMGMELPAFIAREGGLRFRAEEDAAIAALQLNNKVIATGGSVVYGQAAVAALKALGSVVYLKVPIDEIVARVEREPRGIAMVSGTTLDEELRAREVLYLQAADHVVDCRGLDVGQTVAAVIGVLDM